MNQDQEHPNNEAEPPWQTWLTIIAPIVYIVFVILFFKLYLKA